MTKDQFIECGRVKGFAATNMAFFEFGGFTKEGIPAKNKKEKTQVAAKCNVGDVVVVPAGKKRPFSVIPQEEWTNMPATKEEADKKEAEENPTISEMMARLSSLEEENAKLKEEMKKGDK